MDGGLELGATNARPRVSRWPGQCSQNLIKHLNFPTIVVLEDDADGGTLPYGLISEKTGEYAMATDSERIGSCS